ncbi:hypothetical protein [Variovorax sp. PMC12]|uniref:hypothetical protein n=1 Tax=Variovorax sp. PMC12 TaxID=2126319 RepID=UPI000D12AA2B|nr:hypothetical protein [Variovorax sp. PMC12]AVQ84303.1 hypothetical protein C4F17_27020 [Variovorax sp. PMC12]
MNPVLIALVVSLACNGLLGWLYLGQRDDTVAAVANAGQATEQRDGARAAASACSDALDDLRTLADQRGREASAARTAAAGRSDQHKQRADQILSAPPAVPGNVCASAQARIDGWLKARATP